MSEHKTSVETGRFWRIAVLTAAGTIGAASYAEAAVFWSDPDPALSRPAPSAPQRRQNSRRQVGKKIEIQGKEAAKPQGPLVIAISIEKQHLKIYDANGLFAEAPVSTGMRGHSTPMGAFSVIQKQKLHHSNIYSGAPMPFMQRITWSGIAIHAGVLPGYPASHGCIRMPMAFAVKMYGWTKMGARVVITPGEITPASISHPLLAAQKTAPQPMASDELKTSVAMASVEKASVAPVMLEPTASTPLRDQTHTADAGNALPAIKAPVTMSDATPETASAKAGDPTNDDTKSEAVKAAAAKPDATKPSEATRSSEAAIASEPVKANEPNTGLKADDVKPDVPVSQITKPVEKSDTVPDAAKDQGRLADTMKPAIAPDPAIAAAPKRSGQIAVLISRKDAKIYVRQNFSPLYDAPVTIAPSDRPLGTHVFTAQVDKGDANVLHWSVVSLPAPTRTAERRDEDERATRRHRIAGAIEMRPTPVPDSAAEALDRISIPADVMARIAESLSTGGSIIVSDQGITAGETGEGTDFIVSLR